jgi:regulator of replication initiation timing
MKKRSLLEQLDLNLDSIQDPKIKETIHVLFNLIEGQATTIRQLQEENQRLRDENNRLKGEQGKPKIKPSNKNEDDKQSQDISFEKERKKKKRKNKRGSRNNSVQIDRTQVCEVDKAQLPEDAEFKGYETVIVQDLEIKTDNVEFKIEIYYSPLDGKTYRGQLPTGYEGNFGPTVKSLVLIMKNVCNMSEPKILEFLGNVNIHISAGTISNMLIKNKEPFHQEKHDLFEAGLASTRYQQIDDTAARVHGQNQHVQIVCNPFYTAYTTTERKDRLTVIELLQNGAELQYCLNEEALSLSQELGVPQKYIKTLKSLMSEASYPKETFIDLLHTHLPSLKPYARAKILEATAIASYRKGIGHTVIEILLCDDAKQFKVITEKLALCWIHDGRLYKKLSPIVPHHVQELDHFLNGYWEYYHTLLAYKTAPSEELAGKLSDEFDQLFSTQTGYQALDERITKTKEKKEQMLLVLKYPELPLHNNASELGARVQVRKRDVSLHTMSEEGTQANDTFLTIVQTCKKLSVNAFEYIFDRVSGAYQLPSLAQIIRDRTLEYVNLSAAP